VLKFPEEGLVYDYCLDDGGIAEMEAEDDLEEPTQIRAVLLAFYDDSTLQDFNKS